MFSIDTSFGNMNPATTEFDVGGDKLALGNSCRLERLLVRHLSATAIDSTVLAPAVAGATIRPERP